VQIQGDQKIYRNLSFRPRFTTGMAQATYPPTGFFAQLARILVENSTGHACAGPTRRSRGGAGFPVDIQIRARSPKRSGCPVPMSQGAPGPRFFSARCGFSHRLRHRLRTLTTATDVENRHYVRRCGADNCPQRKTLWVLPRNGPKDFSTLGFS
jgi:hypothetical protein